MQASKLTATEAFAAVEALVARAVAHGHVAAIGARGRILLEVRDRIAESLYRPLGSGGVGGGMALALAIATVAGHRLQNVSVIRERQLRHGPVDLLLHLFLQPVDGQLRLVA